MSKFLRTMTALSKKPSDFQSPPPPAPSHSGTVPVSGNKVQSIALAKLVPLSTPASHPDSGTVPVSVSVPALRPRFRVFRATRAEHAHSLGEQIIYEVLWRNAAGDQSARIIQIGYDRLAALASVNWKTARSCLKSLERKLAIEPVQAEDSNRRVGKTYRVYSFTAMLERRRGAGLEWVEKGRGVRFLKPGTMPETGTVPDSTTVPETGTATPVETGTDTVPESGTPLGITRNKTEETSSPPPAPGHQLLLDTAVKHGLVLDDAAALKIVRRCQTADSTTTIEEIAYFTDIKVRQLRGSRSIENWTGLLIAAIPAYFQPPATELKRYRNNQRQIEQKSRETALQILADPDATQQEKQLAKDILGHTPDLR